MAHSKDKWYYGFIFIDRRCEHSERLEGTAGVIRFLKKHLFPKSSNDLENPEIRITDFHKKRILFQSIGGIDRRSELQYLGISLPTLYKEIQEEAVKRIQGPDENRDKEEWEKYYDSIGMSLQEIEMRHSSKLRAKAAQTVRDVARLVEGTYFDAAFNTEDGLRRWSYFDPIDLSVSPLNAQERVRLNPNARVRYRSSGEDVHGFVILDPPE